MGAASVSEYATSLNEQQQQPVNAFIHFMNTNYPQLTNKISFFHAHVADRKKDVRRICRSFCCKKSLLHPFF